ncbi:MAG: DUF6335 family protein [Anaerolineales bacterium]|jgi:hypothetical protein
MTMVTENRDKQNKDRHMNGEQEGKREERQPIDEYTGQPRPEAEDAGKVIEVVPTDTGEHAGEGFMLEEEDSLDKIALDEQTEAIGESASHYTKNEAVAEDFKERQQLAYSGREEMQAGLEQHHALSPNSSADDVDAQWEDTNRTGEESVGGTVATPDQDIVGELGEAVGIEYQPDEPLDTEEKLRERDRQRWELDPRSTGAETAPEVVARKQEDQEGG